MNENNYLPAEEFLRQKRNILFSRISLFGFFVALFISFQDFFDGLYAAPLIDLGFGLILLSMYWLNRIGYHRTAKIITLLLLNFGFAAYASLVPWQIGVFLFYFPVGAMTYALFGPEEKITRNLLSALSFSLILSLFLTEFSLLGSSKIEASNPWISMLINLMASLIASIMCIQFMININAQAEKRLRQLAEEVRDKNANLEKTNMELDRFIYSASHDLRAPLMSIKGLVNLAECETKDKQLLEYFRMIQNRTQKLDDFIKDIINYSRNARTELIWEPIVLSELINICIDDLKYMPQADRVSIKLEIMEKESFMLDKSRMQVVLNNLISNAFKYHDLSKPDPWIKIVATKDSKRTTIQVHDNGSGILTDRQPKIFDMFYRATEESQGSGLGLYIAKEAVEKMNGSILVESTEGMGSIFTIDIPTQPVDDPAADH